MNVLWSLVQYDILLIYVHYRDTRLSVINWYWLESVQFLLICFMDQMHQTKRLITSEMFSMMFSSNYWRECKLNLISTVLNFIQKSVFRFAYTDTLELLTCEQAMDLCSAAQKYNMLHLKQRCVDFLYRHLQPESALRCYELVTKQINDNVLMRKAIKVQFV